MKGLADLVEKQGRFGDSELVHLNPIEVKMLEKMSPTGKLTTNPKTGKKEAFVQFLPAIIAAVATIGSTAYGANRAKKAAKKAREEQQIRDLIAGSAPNISEASEIIPEEIMGTSVGGLEKALEAMEYGGGDVPLPEGDPTTPQQTLDEEELIQLLMEQAPMEQGIMAAMGGPVGTPNDVYYFGVPQIMDMMQDPNPQIQAVGMQLANQMEANPTGGMIPATRDQIQGMAEGGAITAKKFSEGDATFRDPVMEERGYAFDPERNAYYEDIDHPEYGLIRSYFSPRDQSPVPELSDARREADYLLDIVEGNIPARPERRGSLAGGKPRDKTKRNLGLVRALEMAKDPLRPRIQKGKYLSDRDLKNIEEMLGKATR